MSQLVPPDIPALIAELRHPNRDRRAAARAALRSIGATAVPQLAAQVGDPFLRDELMLLLVEIGDPRPLVAALPSAPRHIRRHLRTILSQIGGAAVPPLAALLQTTNSADHSAAIEALAAIDDPAAHDLLLDIAALPDDQNAMLAILALIDNGFNEDVLARILRLLHHPDEWLATRAFTTLLQLEDAGVVVLVAKVLRDERPFLRSMAVRAIPSLVARGYLPLLDGREVLAMMKRDENAIVQAAAAQSLALLPTDS